ncbi:acetate/propionate family kinase [Buchnera aphidicola]|uniref:Acetate kinase n=1 Tax=Buchnera aphidicola subsp. Cinara cedri (strain Cc) TaxID=372461 RepID=ACKA_BUCCC|nr:acetate/propionate family kinase [Buchnera aphidicola]Q057V8.1 RecName: Full=Acetate kinase; AltName: Full=Acetokinase [Buchnera aphidicola BCc]ABJ90591.1 acetate kinase [Buchnera aphidicola BCc]
MKKKLILVLNCGSSSVKFSIIDVIEGVLYISGIANTINNVSFLKIYDIKKKIKIVKKNISTDSYKKLILLICDLLFIHFNKYLKLIIGIGHRIVHGGKDIKKSMIINKKILLKIKKSAIFAPLHNPYHLIAIKIILNKFVKLKNRNVAVFDTSFHQTMPKKSFLYGIPYSFYKKYSIRKYGAHGINHFYITHECSLFLKKSTNNLNIISCHLGSGSSITAIVNGKSIDTSMGLTPLEGLVMGTRCGDIDPYIIIYMIKKLNFSITQIQKILTKSSGVLGISSITSDFRELEKKYYSHKKAKLAIDIFCRRVSKYIAGYSSLMPKGKLDAIVFTGGIGENSSFIRKKIIKNLSIIGFFLDIEKNLIKTGNNNRFIHTINSKPILVIPADENKIIAKETYNILIKNNF